MNPPWVGDDGPVDEVDVLLDDDHKPPMGALAVVRRGLAVSPELKDGLGLTLFLALVGAGGRVLVPVLTQQVIDRGVAAGQVDMGQVWRMTALAVGCLAITTTTNWRTRVRLARAAEGALANLRARVFGHVHKLSIARHAPIGSNKRVPSAGRASSTASNPARTVATATFASRSSSAAPANRSASTASAPSTLTTTAPSKLSWATPETCPSRSCTRSAGPPMARW